MSRIENRYAESLREELNNCLVIYDNESSDETLSGEGFRNMTKTIKSPCSWEKAFYALSKDENMLNEFERFSFIEDDVFSRSISTIKSFEERLEEIEFDVLTHEVGTQEESKEWHWWRANDKAFFRKPVKSFNPYCVLSSRLVKSILDFRDKNKTFLFHEIMFCSLAESLGYVFKSIESLPFYNEYFGLFVWRPIIQESTINDERIYHPVKPKYK